MNKFYTITKATDLPINQNVKPYKIRKNEASGLILHCTASETATSKEVATWHTTPGKNNHLSKYGAPEIAYHFFINKSGVIEKTLLLDKISWHAGGFNTNNLGVVLQYSGYKELPLEQYRATICLLSHLILGASLSTRGNPLTPDDIRGHRELLGTGFRLLGGGKKALMKVCPGLMINLDSLRKDMAFETQRLLKDKSLYLGRIDGIWGPLTKRAARQWYPLNSNLEKVVETNGQYSLTYLGD